MANDQFTGRTKLTGLAQHYWISPFHGDQQSELAKAGFALTLRTGRASQILVWIEDEAIPGRQFPSPCPFAFDISSFYNSLTHWET
jgi:hypothetical protein